MDDAEIAIVSFGSVSRSALRAIRERHEQWQRDAEGKVPSRPFLALGLSDNVSYTYDPAAPHGSHITEVYVDGAPIDPAATAPVKTVRAKRPATKH